MCVPKKGKEINSANNLWFYTARGGQEKEKTKQCKTLVVFAKVVNLYY